MKNSVSFHGLYVSPKLLPFAYSFVRSCFTKEEKKKSVRRKRKKTTGDLTVQSHISGLVGFYF